MFNSPLSYSAGLLRCCRNTIRRFARTDAEGATLECVHCLASLRVRGGLWEPDTISPVQDVIDASALRERDLGVLTAPLLPTHARAPLAHLSVAQFVLDHLTSTATPLRAFSSSVPNVPPHEGVTAAIEPFAEARTLEQLTGLSLRLGGHPFHNTMVYTIARRA